MRNTTSNIDWFREAYKWARIGLPFSLFTAPATEEEIKIFAKTNDARVIDKLLKVNEFFYSRLPTEAEFAKEKERIIPHLSKRLQKQFSFADTGIYFGTTRGDIDICLISSGGTTEREYKTIENQIRSPDFKVAKEFPMLDRDSLLFFYCSSGTKFAKRVIKSRELANPNFKQEVEHQYAYARQTVNDARVLWGNPAELVRARQSPTLITPR